jgi:hypothetical protein
VPKVNRLSKITLRVWGRSFQEPFGIATNQRVETEEIVRLREIGLTSESLGSSSDSYDVEVCSAIASGLSVGCCPALNSIPRMILLKLATCNSS